MPTERLQKVLARAGVASRRVAETLIVDGRVRVDGTVVTELGTKVDPKRSRIEVDGKRLSPEPLCYGILHKPRGMLTSLHDPEGRPTVLKILKEVGLRVVPVGRLDFNTSGALLFTNDGAFAEKLGHARSRTKKVYAAKIQSEVTEAQLEKWRKPITIEGKETRPAEVKVLRREEGKTWLEITLSEGKNRQIRRLGESVGTPVVRLSRLSQAGVSADRLKPGQWRLLSIDELKSLKNAHGVPEKIRGLSQDREELKRAGQSRVRVRVGKSSGSSPGRPRRQGKESPGTRESTNGRGRRAVTGGRESASSRRSRSKR